MLQYNAAAAACTECPYVRLRPLQLSSSELSDAQKGRSPKEKFLGATTTAVAWAAMTWLNVAAAAAAAIHPGTPQLALEVVMAAREGQL